MPGIEEVERLPRDAPEFAQSATSATVRLELLGFGYSEQQRYADAERVLRRALALQERCVGSACSEIASVLDRLAETRLHQQDLEEADALYLRALLIEETGLRPDTLYSCAD